MYWSFSDVICRIHACSREHTMAERRDASARIIKNAPTISKADIWHLWTTWEARPGEDTLCVNQRFSIPVLPSQYAWLLFYSYLSSFWTSILLYLHYIFWKVMLLLLEYVFSVLFPPLIISQFLSSCVCCLVVPGCLPCLVLPCFIYIKDCSFEFTPRLVFLVPPRCVHSDN